MKRILIFVHYNPNNSFHDYVQFWLESLRPHFSRIVFVSNSALSEQAERVIKSYTDHIITRENRGFDFGAWKDTLHSEGWGKLSGYDSLTLMNDTGFGPISEIGQVYAKMEKQKTDFWGLTEHRATRSGMPGTNKPVPRHIQSYFIVFNKRVIESEIFRGFWNSVQNYKTREKVIQHCEAKLTKHLKQSGFVFDTVVKADHKNDLKPNVSELYPEKVLVEGSPFLKVKSFFQTDDSNGLKKLVKQISGYNIQLIENYFDEVYPPDKNMLVNNKTVVLNNSAKKENVRSDLKKVIFFDVADADLFTSCLHLLKDISTGVPLFVTTDTKEIKSEIEARLDQNRSSFPALGITFVDKNDGLFALLQQKGTSKVTFDMAGYFRVENLSKDETADSQIFVQAVQKDLIKSMNSVGQLFEENNQLGIVLPDLPPISHKSHENDVRYLEEFWMSSNRNKKSASLGIPLFKISHCAGFWFRPIALDSLFNLLDGQHGKDSHGQQKNLHNEKLLHYLPVYLCWDQGFDFRILVDPENVKSRFEWVNAGNEELVNDKIKKSLSWQIGRALTWTPRIAAKFFRRKISIN